MTDRQHPGSVRLSRLVRGLAVATLLTATPLLVSAQQPETEVPVQGLSLTGMHGELKTFASLRGKPTVVMFFSTRCPMSNAFNSRRNDLYHGFKKRARFLVIDSELNETLDEERTYAKQVGFDFPVFHDADGKAAALLGARVTTDAFVLDANGVIRYHGYIEDAPNPERTTKPALRLALSAVLDHQSVAVPRTRAVGCAIHRYRLEGTH